MCGLFLVRQSSGTALLSGKKKKIQEVHTVVTLLSFTINTAKKNSFALDCTNRFNFVFQISVLGLAGSLTVKDTVWGVMGKLMTNQLALKVNWKGCNGKMAFGTLAVNDVVKSKLGINVCFLMGVRHHRKSI